MRISDWSSDVCSSDLELVHSRTTPPDRPRALRRPARHHHRRRLRPRAGPAPELHRPRPGRLRPRPRLRRRTLRLGPRRPPPPHRPPRRAVLQPVRPGPRRGRLRTRHLPHRPRRRRACLRPLPHPRPGARLHGRPRRRRHRIRAGPVRPWIRTMTILRCSQKLLKRLRQPATPPGPVPGSNPLGEWCADIDFIDRQPFALLMNAATGTVMVLPARAADLTRLHAMAAEKLGGLRQACGIGGGLAEAGLGALREPFRAEERRGGKEWVSTCVSRWVARRLKKNNTLHETSRHKANKN